MTDREERDWRESSVDCPWRTHTPTRVYCAANNEPCAMENCAIWIFLNP